MVKALKEKELGYLFGLFEGDGYKIYDKNSRHYQVEFFLNSERDDDIISFLINLLKKSGLNPHEYQDKRYKCKRIRVYSKTFFESINKNISLDTRNKDFVMGFVSGFIDAEGHVNDKKSYIMVVNTNKKVLTNIQNFLEKNNIKSTVSKRKPSEKDVLASYRMYISVTFKNMPHLSIKLGRANRYPYSGVGQTIQKKS